LIKAKENFSGMGLDKHIGIIPQKEPSVITSERLEWQVTEWPTEFGGQTSTSDHAKEDWVTIETTKDVSFTIDLHIHQPQHRERSTSDWERTLLEVFTNRLDYYSVVLGPNISGYPSYITFCLKGSPRSYFLPSNRPLPDLARVVTLSASSSPGSLVS
jgi:hypothetical protein